MPRNSSGVYSLPVAAFVPGTTIVASQVNADFSDIATALTQSLATTGVSTMTGPIKGAAGTLAAPSYSFAAELGSGRYYVGAQQYTDVINGIALVVYTAAGISVVGNAAVSGALSVTGNITKNGVAVDAFGSATKTLFFQTAAPTGWTKDVTLDNATIQLVSGTVGADAGTTNFTSVFGTRSLLANQLPNAPITITDPTHRHGINGSGNTTSSNGVTILGLSSGNINTDFASTGVTAAIDNTSRGGGVQQSLGMDIKYAQAIRASKN